MCLPPTVLVPTSCALKAQRCHRFCAQTRCNNSEIHFFCYNQWDGKIGCYAAYDQISTVVAAKVYFWVIAHGLCAKTVTALAFKAQDVGTKTVGGRHTTFTYTLFSVWSVVLYIQWNNTSHHLVEQQQKCLISIVSWTFFGKFLGRFNITVMHHLWRGVVRPKNCFYLWSMLETFRGDT